MFSKQNLILLSATVVLAVVISFFNVNLPIYIFIGLMAFGVISFFIFKNPITGLYLITFFLPFERIGAYQLGGYTIRISQVLFIILLLVWLSRLIFQRKFDFAKNPLIIPLVIFLLINILSLQNAPNLERSLLVLAFIVFTILLSLVIPNLLRGKKTIEKTILILLVSAFLVSIFGIFQFLGDMAGLPTTITGLRNLYTKEVLGFPRIQSTAHEPLYFANYLLIPLSLAFSLFLSGRGKIKWGWLLILLILGMINLVLTVSRGGYLALAVVILIVSLIYFRKVFTLRNLIILAAVLIIVWLVVVRALGFGGEIFNLDIFKEHVANVFYGPSYQERIDTFENAMTAWREHPILGIGPGGFGPYMTPHPYYMLKSWKIVNNEFIEILAENGILGLLAFCLIILVLLARSIKAVIKAQDKYLKAIMIALFAAFIGVIVQYQTFSTLYIMHVWFLVGLMVAVQNLVLANKNLTVKDNIS